MQYLFDATKRFDDPLVNLVLKHLLIKVWVDSEEFHIAKIDAELANPLYALGGLAAKLNPKHNRRRAPIDIWRCEIPSLASQAQSSSRSVARVSNSRPNLSVTESVSR